MKTHSQACKAAMRSLFRLLEAIEDEPHRALELSALRHLSAMRLSGDTDPEPIEHSTLRAVLRPPHPLAGNAHGLVGDFDLYDHYRSTGEMVGGWAGWSVRTDGSIEFVVSDGSVSQDPIQPLCAEPDEYGGLTLSGDWYRRDLSPHCDPGMPAEDRERIAKVLETAGDYDPDGPQPRGCAWCQTLGIETAHSESNIPGDPVANTKPLRWEPVALAALVRAKGLRIDPVLLRERFGVDENGRRPSIVHSRRFVGRRG